MRLKYKIEKFQLVFPVLIIYEIYLQPIVVNYYTIENKTI